jgi:hypothetical protein
MLRLRLPLMFIAVSALWALAAHAEDRLLLKPVNVDLPFGDRVFEGPGSDVANNNCLAPISRHNCCVSRFDQGCEIGVPAG